MSAPAFLEGRRGLEADPAHLLEAMATASRRRTRVAVIGAGPAGTAALRAFHYAREHERCEVVCFEQQADLGGLWNFSWRTGIDGTGAPVHNGMYKHLWSNGPKECLEFADYSFEEHFGRSIPSFPPREVLHDYINGRMEKFNLRRFCKFNHRVTSCAWDEKAQEFNLRALDTKSGVEQESTFDYVLVASGHFSCPNVPEFPGFQQFQGRIMHSHDFRDAAEFRGQRLLVIGSSYSAEDIASQCYKYGAANVTISFRTKDLRHFHWPAGIKVVPILERMEGKTAHFQDGSSTEVDCIILCTGYRHSFPFIDRPIRLETPNVLAPANLYKGLVWTANPRIFYLGMQDEWFTFTMFDAQAWYARDVVLGRIALPDRAAMERDIATWIARSEKLASDEDCIRFQGSYVKDLLAQTDYPKIDITGCEELFLEWEHNKHENIMSFRDKAHRSVVTGKMAPEAPTPWLENFDDTVKAFVPGYIPATGRSLAGAGLVPAAGSAAQAVAPSPASARSRL